VLDMSTELPPALPTILPNVNWATYNESVKTIQDTYYRTMQDARAEADRRTRETQAWLNGELAKARLKYDADIAAARKSVLTPSPTE